MENEKSVFVDEDSYKKIVEELGYKPSNLFICRYLPDKHQAIIIDNEQLNYKPIVKF